MFVSVAVDAGSEERARELAELLSQYGFVRVQRGLWEATAITPGLLARLKRDMDRATDAFDRLRFFQFPMEGALVLSSLRDKKWRRIVARYAESAAPVQKSLRPQTGIPVPNSGEYRGPERRKK